MCKNFLVFVLLWSLVYGLNLHADDLCSDPGRKCKPFFECPAAMQQVKENEFHKLRRCGFSGLQELVCCPDNNDVTEASKVTVTKRPVEVDVTEASKVTVTKRPAEVDVTEASKVTVTKRPAEVEITESNTKLHEKASVTKKPSEVENIDDVCKGKGIGKCKSFFECPVAIKQVKENEFHKLTRCGFSGLKELVCCPDNDVTIPSNYDKFTKRAITEVVPIDVCRYKGNGKCKPIIECPFAIEQVKDNEFHKLTRCGFSGLTELVCCPDNNVESLVDEIARKKERKRPAEMEAYSTEVSLVDDKFAEDKRPAELECDNIIKSFPPPTSSYIIGGTNTTVGEFPHMVAIGFIKTLDDNNSTIKFICGGSLVSSRYVLTAAHCQSLRISSEFRMRIGVVDQTLSDQDTDYNVVEIHTHPNHRRNQKYNDLSLFKLDRDVQFTSYRYPICLNTMSEIPESDVIVTGWGRTDTEEISLSRYLLKATLTIIKRSECSNFFQPQRSLEDGITDKFICAVDPDKIKDSCQGDSGGPLQVLTSNDGHFRLIGITAFGKSCGGITPGVYTNVQKHLDWIESVVWPQYFVSGS